MTKNIDALWYAREFLDTLTPSKLHSNKSMSFFVNPTFNVTVTGGSQEENDQLCVLIQHSLTRQGMNNVTLDECVIAPQTACDDVTSCLRRLNPDLFDTHITITGECEADVQSQAIGLGIFGATNSFPNFFHH